MLKEISVCNSRIMLKWRHLPGMRTIYLTLAIIALPLFGPAVDRATGQVALTGSSGGGRPTLIDPQAVPMATQLALTPGAQIYLFGGVAGGAAPISPFAHGNEKTVSDIEGTSTVELAATRHANNSFQTGCAYFDIAGVGVSHFSTMRFLSKNRVIPETGDEDSGSYRNSVAFTVAKPTLAVAIGMGSSQQAIRFVGPSGLKTDAATTGNDPGHAIGIAHVYLNPGTYRITAKTTVVAAGQDTGHMTCLLGVYLFGYGNSARPSPPLITPGATAANPPSNDALNKLIQSFGQRKNSTTIPPSTATLNGLGTLAAAWGAIMLSMAAFYWLFALAGLTTIILLCLMFQKCLGCIPKEYRRLEPAMAWLMLVPGLGGIWVFVLLFSLAGSYQDYFKRRGRTDVGDCGYGLAKKYLIFAILSVVIPIIGWFILSIVSLVIFIRACMRAWELKHLVEADINGAANGAFHPEQPVPIDAAMVSVPPAPPGARPLVAVRSTPPPPPPPRNRGDEPPPLSRRPDDRPPPPLRPAGMPPPPGQERDKN